MTDPTSSSPDRTDGPIDAEFEPVSAPRRTRAVTSSGPGWLTILALGAVSFGGFGLAAVSAGMMPGIPGPAPRTDGLEASLASVQSELAALRTQVTDLEAGLAQSNAREDISTAQAEKIAGLSRSLTTVQSRLNSLQTDLSDIETRLAETPAESLARPVVASPDPAILSRLETLEQALVNQPQDAPPTDAPSIEAQSPEEAKPLPPEDPQSPPDTSASDAALALSAIEAAARRGTAFQVAYQRLTVAMPDFPGLQRLAPIAASGASTLSELRDQFTLFKRAALDREAATSGAGPGWMRTLFGDGITVRRAGTVTASDRLDAAETALADGDIKTAIREIEALDPDIQSVFTDWLKDARNRQTLEDVLESLRLAMIAKDRP